MNQHLLMHTQTLLNCPFCGYEMDVDDLDTVYPSGTYWRDVPDLGRRYISRRDRLETDGRCFNVVCQTSSGGCGASITADSRQEAITAWNRRK